MRTTYYEQQIIDYCVVNANEGQGYWACLDDLPKALNLTTEQINGVITSLQNKGFAYVEKMRNSSSIVWLTDKAV